MEIKDDIEPGHFIKIDLDDGFKLADMDLIENGLIYKYIGVCLVADKSKQPDRSYLGNVEFLGDIEFLEVSEFHCNKCHVSWATEEQLKSHGCK